MQDFELGITSDDIFLVKRFFATRMAVLGRRLYLRQRCISTAVVCVSPSLLSLFSLQDV